METLFIYLAKSSGLIGMFYFSYYFLLRKETFFNSNRWFLLTGLITSNFLPLLVFKKIIWVNPIPENFDWSKIPVTTPIENDSFEINWYLVFGIIYGIGILVFLLKFVFDFYSLSKILKGKTIRKQEDYNFIDVTENISPFSYFNYIVYNSSLYSDKELENILEHEKVHSAQNHTIDVLISRLFCVVFWFNPFMWLYKKAITQNLEFIADSEATKNITDKKAYQFTLLKITTHENCVAITNHFYQSLIKKRIVMLNKNQSKKRNSWKYAFVIPVLVGFVLLFQIKVIAQDKLSQNSISDKSNSDLKGIIITKNSSNEDLKNGVLEMKEKYGVNLKFSKVKRNSSNEIIAIHIYFNDGKGNYADCDFDENQPINPTPIYYEKNGAMGIGNIEENKNEKLNGKETVSKSPPPLKTSKATKATKDIKNAIIIINSKKTSATLEDLNKTDQNLIQNINVLKGKNAIEKYGKDGENGAIEIITKENADLLKSSNKKSK